jgi:hypothetical protein
MVPTESLIQSPQNNSIPTGRQRLLDLLKRERVQKTLNQYGISQGEAVARINSLTDEELNKIAGKLDQLKAGGHDPYGYDDDDDDWIAELFLITLLIGLIAVAYFLGLLVKAVACPFFDDCTASFLFRPWWDFESVPNNEFPRDRQYYEPSLPSPVIPDTLYNGSSQDCDSRQQACEWSVR